MAAKPMTQAEKAKAYDALRARAGSMGFACVGYALDEAEERTPNAR